jgi:hypothetical protein
MRVARIAIICLGVGGCTQATWFKPGASLSDFETEKAACEYEAAKATASSGGVGFGMSAAIGAGIDEGLKRAEVQNLCMRSRGWSLQRN